MSIKIEKSFSVAAPRAAVWRFLTDPERVAGCLPGASITEQVDERTYKGKMSMKVGPVSASYRGKVTFERLDEEAGEADLKASAQDVSGRGGAEMTMSSKIVELDPGNTEVTVISEVNVMGLLAQLGRGMIQDVSDVMFEQFTDAMRQDLASAPVEPPVEAAAAEPAATTETAAPEAAPPVPEAPAAEPAAEPTETKLDAVDFGAKVARRAFLRRLSSPGFWIVVAIVAAVIWFVLR